MSQRRNEDCYFLEQEAALRAKWRAELEAKAVAARKRQELAAKVGGKEDVARRLQELGIESETVPALHLMPLVAVAWADGQVSPRERQAVMQVAAAHGIQPGSAAALLLASMLEARPAAAVMDQILSVLHDLLAARGLHPRDLVQACTDVASASGGFLGLGGKISDQERQFIRKLAETFAANGKQVLDKLQ